MAGKRLFLGSINAAPIDQLSINGQGKAKVVPIFVIDFTLPIQQSLSVFVPPTPTDIELPITPNQAIFIPPSPPVG